MRTHYNNGDGITLQYTGCDGCNPSAVNGVLCHEHGCPYAWKDTQRECKWCGTEFWPEYAGQYCCDDDCARANMGL